MTAVFAHRGCTEGFTENTLEAFAEARRRGADGVELDVRRSADGALVVHHDAEVPGAGLVSELTVARLPDHVPLLADALAACEGMVVNVEIKNWPGDPGYEADHAIAADVASAIVEAGWGDRVIVSCFDRDTASAVLAAEPGLDVGWLLEVRSDPLGAVAEAADLGFGALHPFVLGVTEDLVAAAHRAGLAVNTWTVNAPQDVARMVVLGVDVVITDYLDQALAIARAVPAPERPGP